MPLGIENLLFLMGEFQILLFTWFTVQKSSGDSRNFRVFPVGMKSQGFFLPGTIFWTFGRGSHQVYDTRVLEVKCKRKKRRVSRFNRQIFLSLSE